MFLKLKLTKSQIILICRDIEVAYLQDGYNGDKSSYLKRERIVKSLEKQLINQSKTK